MADEEMEYFDENVLFSEFDAVSNQQRSTYSSCDSEEQPKLTSNAMVTLKEENNHLKNMMRKLLAAEKDRPYFMAIFYNTKESTESQQNIESFLYNLSIARQNSNSELEAQKAAYSRLQPSVSALNKLIPESEGESSNDLDQLGAYNSVINCVKYFEVYCVDRCGYPLCDYEPRDSEGWEIPIYDQVYFTALPCDEDNTKIKMRKKKTCFNCGCMGHNVSECPDPQNAARIEAKRREFMNKFSSPFARAKRYHLDEERFGSFKPGVISDNLREALGIGPDELPPYIYKMRILGYPPGYLPSDSKATLSLYDADGNVDDYVMEDLNEEEDESSKQSVFIEYPGFNCSLPQGFRGESSNGAVPPMREQHQIPEMERLFKQKYHCQSGDTRRGGDKKRNWAESNTGAEDMELDLEEQCQLALELKAPGSKQRKVDQDNNQDKEGGYSPSHPGIQYGAEEQNLFKQLHPGSTNTKIPNWKLNQNEDEQCKAIENAESAATSSSPKVRKQRKVSSASIEDGEIISDEELQCESCEEGEEPERKSCQGWWLTVPLNPSLQTFKNVSPPPVPAIKLPIDLLTRFYTSSTVLQSVSFEDRIMWLDPIYGNIQVSSGRYDKLKEILQKRSKRSNKK